LTCGFAISFAVWIGFTPPVFYVALVFTVICWYLAPKIWIAHEASRTLSEERRAGTLEMILSTPVSVREIVWFLR
jgi:ABC-type Na+ efflux pump permease subunit